MDFAAELLPMDQKEKKHIRADPVHRYEPFPLTEIQRAYWMGQSPGLVLNSSTHYLLELDGVDVDLERMEGAWNRLIQHHDMMRVVVESAEQQKILAQVSIQSIVRSHALQHGAEDTLDAARQYLKSCWNQLSLTHDRGNNWPPFRICAAAYGENRCRIGIIFDYLTLDGYSIKLLLDQLALLYINPQASLPVTEISFRDYVLHVQPKPETQARSEAFWREKLSDLPLAPALPLAVDPAELQEPQFFRREAIISRSQWISIKERARKNQITASVFLLTAYSQIIRRWSGDDDFTLNLTLFDRQNIHPDVEKLLGDFTSLTPIAFRLSNGADLLSQARATQSEIAAALEHREISSIWIQRERARDMGLVAAALPVVFTSTLGLGDGLFEKSSPGFPILATGGLSSTPQVWLDHQLYEYDGELVVSWDAVEGLFPDGMLDVMFEAYVDLLVNLAADDWTQPVSIPLPEEQIKIRKTSEQSSPTLPADLLHIGMFSIAATQPQRTALIVADMSISYSELAQKALRIAAMLQQNGMRSGDAVAVKSPRGVGQICAVFGILAAGGCYVPIGIHQPDVRRAKIYATAGIRWEIGAWTDATTIDDITALTRLTVEQAEAFEPLSAPLSSTADDSAYIIFTSGSTGEPKGVEVTHVAAFNTIDAINSRYGIHSNSRVLAVSALDFDLSVYDIFGLLGAGGAVVVLDEEQRRDAAVWLDLIHRHQVTVWNSVPVLLEMLLVAAATDSRSFSFEQVFLSGDWIGLDLPKRLFAKSTHDTKLVAMGGATEAAIWSNAFDVSVPLPEHWRSIPYGKPLANQRYRVVDTQGQDCPDWVPGELWIGGVGVAVGYRGDPKQTTERFVEYQGERWYRTGDMGRYWSDGNLEFLGRRDHQVKVRGHRIELGEVEAALTNLSGVARSVALTIGNPAVLAAAYVPVDNRTTPAANELVSALHSLLPDYMVPTYLQAVDDIPLSSNGKIDRKLLAQIFSENAQEKESALTAPETDIEVRLVEIWQRLLKCDHIGRESSFFSLGGDSLLATRLITELGAQGLGAEQPLRLLFARPVLRDFAAALAQVDVKQVTQIIPTPEQKYSPFPLTEVQRAYWMGRNPGLPLNCGTHFLLEFEGPSIDLNLFQKACKRLVAHHDMLRVMIDEDGFQRISPIELSQGVEITSDLEPDACHARKNFSLWWEKCTKDGSTVIFRAHVVYYGDNRCRLGLLFDYLYLDGYSIKLLVQELAELYQNPDKELPELDLSFRDYVVQVKADPVALSKAETYWRSRLENLPPAAALPTACDPRKLRMVKFKRRTARIEQKLWSGLKETARQQTLTPTVLILGAYGEILSRWSGGGAHTINLTMFDRQPVHPDIVNIVGDFTTLAPIAYQPVVDANLYQLASRMQDEIAEALEHREISSVWVQRERARSIGLTAAALPIVFTSTLGMADSLFDDMPADSFPDLDGAGLSETPQVWLDHQMYEHRGELLLSWDAVEELFPDGMLDDMFSAFQELLKRLIIGVHPQPEALHLPPLQIGRNNTSSEFNTLEAKHLLHDGMFAVAKSNPGRPALIEKDIVFSYGELAERALRIANFLKRRGMRSGELVAITLPRGIDQICAVFGVLAAGGCYVPVSIQQPAARRVKIHATANIHWILSNSEYLQGIMEGGVQVLNIQLAEREAPLLEPEQGSPDSSAYIIFTSGSTGEPKGVEITHAAAANTIDAINTRYGIHPDSRVLAVSSLDFDLSVYDIFGLLGVGGAIVLVDEEKRRDAAAWLNLVHQHQVTVWNSVPVLLDMLLVMATDDPRPLSFEQVLLSGDWIGLDLPARLFYKAQNNTRLVAMGGATEAAIWSNAFDVSLPLPEHWRSIPYGKPLANQRYRVVDVHGRDCPDWVPGELWIGGVGVAVGYRGDPKQTADRFVEYQGERWYRTGDMGRYWPDGNLEFLGRRDHQVKVRGHRIELGEIEAALTNLPEVIRAVAVTVGNPLTLAAIYVPNRNEKISDTNDLTAALRRLLPDYMVPSWLQAVDEIPLNSNGKVDRNAASNILENYISHTKNDEPPQSELENQIAAVWREVLKRKYLSRNEDFFLVGGDSLKATRIVQLLKTKRISPDSVPLLVLFSNPTIAALADYINAQLEAIRTTDDDASIEEGII